MTAKGDRQNSSSLGGAAYPMIDSKRQLEVAYKSISPSETHDKCR